MNTIEKILTKIVLLDNGCWECPSLKLTEKGYLRIRIEGKHQYLHKYLYENFVGKVKEGFELDHLCRNKACINIDHLESVSHKVNVQRGLVPILAGGHQL